MHRLVSVQRELQRSQSESAVVEARQRNKRIVQEMKADMDTRVGRDLNAKFASIEMAPPDEVPCPPLAGATATSASAPLHPHPHPHRHHGPTTAASALHTCR